MGWELTEDEMRPLLDLAPDDGEWHKFTCMIKRKDGAVFIDNPRVKPESREGEA